jgi:GNAT superfamily N-acetyltransferase
MSSESAEKYIHLADRPDLIPVLADWIYEEWGHNDSNNSPEKVRSHLIEYLNLDQIPLTTVIMRDSQPIASASLKIREMETHPQYLHWLGGVYVHPKYRQQGIGSRLVEHAAGEAKRLAVEDLYLYTRSHVRFYTQLGWQVIERPIYEGRLAIVMKRILSVDNKEENYNDN